MKKIIYLLAIATIGIHSCQESKPKSSLEKVTVSDESEINIVRNYKEGKNLDLLFKNERGNYFIDENVNNSLNAMERAAIDFYLVAYDIPAAGDFNKIPSFLEGVRWPIQTFEFAFDNREESIRPEVKMAMHQAMENRKSGVSNPILERLSVIRNSEQTFNVVGTVRTNGNGQDFDHQYEIRNAELIQIK
ncbi:MAG: hypothetical protein RL204_1860 [Bacteroidota bacterium]|jgi:hypothetical protein